MKNFTSCFKEKSFLRFFFSRLKFNTTGRYVDDFPYVSPCGSELNFVRCDDLPIVFTHILEDDNEIYLSYNHTDNLLKVPFEPQKLYMCPRNGRLYHPSFLKIGNVGLVKSSLAILLSKNFFFSNTDQPEKFLYKDKKYLLTQELKEQVDKLSKAEPKD